MPIPKGSKYPAGRHYRTHGRTRTKEYTAWCQMLQRCLKRDHPAYADYGGRGIGVCERWQQSFEAFLEDMGEAPSKRHTLERRENGGHYEPGNVVWATQKEQARNRRSCVIVEYAGRRQCLAVWAEELRLPKNTLVNRLRRGWTVEEAITGVKGGRVWRSRGKQEAIKRK